MLVGHRVDPVVSHEWVRPARRPVNVKLFFQEMVNGRVESERRTGDTAHPTATVDVKAAWAIHEELELGAAELIGFRGSRIVDVAGAGLRHCPSVADFR